MLINSYTISYVYCCTYLQPNRYHYYMYCTVHTA